MNEEPKKIGDNRQPDGTFGPGNVANPNGRPKGSISIVAAIKKKLEEYPEGKEKTYLYYLVEKIFKKAIIEDDVVMIRDIINRVDGMPQQDITSGGNPIPLLGGQSNDTNNLGNKEITETKKEDTSD